MKICYIPAKDKVRSCTKLYSMGSMAMLSLYGLEPKSIEVIETVTDINGTRTITTIYGNPHVSSGGFGIKEVILIVVVAVGAYYVRKQFIGTKQPSEPANSGIDMSLFDRSSKDDEGKV